MTLPTDAPADGAPAAGTTAPPAAQGADGGAPAGTTTAPSTAPAAVEGSLLTSAQATAPADGDKPADGAKPAADAPVVPESYEFKMPEGMALDEAITGEFSDFAKELKLDQGQAQKVADLGVKLVQQAQAAQAEHSRTTVAQWAVDAKADPDIGGAKFNETMRMAAVARDAFATPKLNELLDASGFGNHPELIRLFSAIGRKISPDGVHGGGASAQRSAADILFDGK